MNRVCKSCKVEKPIDKFTRNKGSKGGYFPICSVCRNLKYANKAGIYRNNFRFGINPLEILKRDNFACLGCGITNEAHIIKYKRRLTIDHKDNKGICVPARQKNNNPSNLQTLCCKCHGKKDGRLNYGRKHQLTTPKK